MRQKALTLAGNGHRHRTTIAIVGAIGAPLLLTACAQSQPSADQLRTIAHEIPLPAGATFVSDTDRLQRPGDFGTQSQHQVALTYKLATTVDCGQLTATWRDALKQAHRKFHEDAAAPGEFILTSGDVTIALLTGDAGKSCSTATISLGVQN